MMFLAEKAYKIQKTGVMAIVRANKERAFEIAKGCLAGGVDVIEISYTNNDAGEVIKALKEEFGDQLLVGAGTVLDSETARLAILNGAEFIVAPNFKKEVAEITNRYQIPYGPGCTTFTESIEAIEAGSSFIKAFPISNFYGSSLVEVFRTPVPHLPILVSGGVTLENAHEWIAKGAACLGVGGLLTKGSGEDIAKNAKKLREIVETTRAKKK